MRALRPLVCCFAILAAPSAGAQSKKAPSDERKTERPQGETKAASKEAPKAAGKSASSSASDAKSSNDKGKDKVEPRKTDAARKDTKRRPRHSADKTVAKNDPKPAAKRDPKAAAKRDAKSDPPRPAKADSKNGSGAGGKAEAKSDSRDASAKSKSNTDSAIAAAPSAPDVGPGPGAGSRTVVPKQEATLPTPSSESAPQATPAQNTPQEPVSPSDEGASAKSHRVGRPPKNPKSQLPSGAERPTANPAVRRAIAGGPTLEDSLAKAADPELDALRAADRVLFPKPLHGFEAGWSWPGVAHGSRGPEVVASGLPAEADLAPKAALDESAVTAEWIRSLTMPNLPVRLEARVVRYLKFYRDNSRGKSIARVWAKKSGRFVPSLKAELSKAGLPTDLVWLSLIESGHNPTIASPAGAAGLWQFMPESGRMYGLVVDRWVDERLDPKRSTEAAIAYLSDLYRRFGNWELAMAAYNMGHGGLTRAIQKFNSNDFWELSKHEAAIPWETTLYVPKIFAIAIVMNNKRAFGIADVAPEAPEHFEAVLVPSGTSLSAVASAAGLSDKSLEALNPHLLSGRVPPLKPGERRQGVLVRVPQGRGPSATRTLAAAQPEAGLASYLVKLGDTPETVAASASAGIGDLRRLNRLRSDETLTAGDVLLVPRRSREPAPAGPTPEVVVVPDLGVAYPNRDRVFVLVRDGDSLGALSKALAVTEAELQRWNALDPTARLLAGMTLQAWVERGKSAGVRVFREADTRVLAMGTPEFIEYFEEKNGKARVVIKARAGETLSRIGRRYGVSSGWMERINRKSRHTKLKAGESVVLYLAKDRAGAVADDEREAKTEPLPPIDAPAPEALPAVPEAPSASSPTRAPSGS
ncbi:MAG: transglycosylase SLT domain-containing protein [Polyangiaceae bacterium]